MANNKRAGRRAFWQRHVEAHRRGLYLCTCGSSGGSACGARGVSGRPILMS
jgi:hypothetical protein